MKQLPSYLEDALCRPDFVCQNFEWLVLTHESTATKCEFLQILQSIGESFNKRAGLGPNILARVGDFLAFYLEKIGIDEFTNKERSMIVSVAETLSPKESNRIKLSLLKLNVNPSPADPPTPSTLFTRKYKETANTLTWIDWKLFTKIKSYEFLNQAWTKAEKVTKAPTLTAFSRRFDLVTFWVATKILQAEPHSQSMAIEHFIQVMWRLYKLKNYNTMSMILCGLNQSCIVRLKSTWKKVSKQLLQKFEQLDKLMSPSENYALYREEIKTVDASNCPVIPYIPLVLRDITYIQDGNRDIPGEFNAKKFSMIGREIRQLLSHQHPGYAHLQSNVDEINEFYFTHLPNTVFDEEHLFALSFLHQPKLGPGSPPPKSKISYHPTSPRGVSELPQTPPSQSCRRSSMSRLPTRSNRSVTVLRRTIEMNQENSIKNWTVNDVLLWAQEVGIPELQELVLRYRLDGDALLSQRLQMASQLEFLDEATLNGVLEAVEFVRTVYLSGNMFDVPLRKTQSFNGTDGAQPAPLQAIRSLPLPSILLPR